MLGELVLSRGDILEKFPFFGQRSLFVDSVRVQLDAEGSPTNRAIGLWTVPREITADHFADFVATIKDKEVKVEGLNVLPGHFWPEALGQGAGVLAAVRHPEQLVNVLPIYRDINNIHYWEAALAGDLVNLCVELGEPTANEKGGLRLLARGVAVFNERRLSLVGGMDVDVMDLERGVRGLGLLKRRHTTEPWVPANFDNFDQYFAPEKPKEQA